MSTMGNGSMPNLAAGGSGDIGTNAMGAINNQALNMSKSLPMNGDPTGMAPQMLGMSQQFANPAGLVANAMPSLTAQASSMSSKLPFGGDPTGIAPQITNASAQFANPAGLLGSLFGGL